MKKNKKTVSALLDYGMIGVLIIMIAVFACFSKNFLTVNTLFTILKKVAITGIISVGMTFVLLTGGIDLSVGSISGCTAVTAAILMKNYNLAIPFTLLITLVLALIYGLFNGFCITKLNIPPLIATLGLQISLRGLAYIVTSGLPVFGFNNTFSKFASGTVLSIPYPVILLAVIFVIGIFLLHKSTIGRHIYGIGGNEEASRLSGINVVRVKLFAYSVSGLLSGIAGLVLLSRTNSGQPSLGSGYEMDAITAVVLGGVSLNGGIGKLPMVIIGVLIMGILSTGMIMCSINDYVQQLVQGLVLILAVAFSQFASKTKAKMIVAD